MFLCRCRACHMINICRDVASGSLMSCGKCQHTMIAYPNLTIVDAEPLVCEVCGSRAIRERWLDGRCQYQCDDCMTERGLV